MNEENNINKKNEKFNMNIGEALFSLGILIPWVMGVALCKDSFWNGVFAFIIPPYAWIITASWVIEIIHKIYGV